MRLSNFLENKVIWITGASSGLGRELAIELAKYPVKLILSARNDLKLKETKKLCSLPDDRCLILPLDLTSFKEEQIQMIQDRILLKFGSLDLLIHNASISQRSLAHLTCEPVDRKIMETIFFGPLRITKTFLPHLIKNPKGQIVIISSLAGKFGVPLRSSYSAAKHALHGFFEALKLELSDELHVQFFVLGGVKTDSAKNALKADGSIHNKKDQWHERNMPADECARRIIEKLPSKRGEFTIGKVERLGLWVRKHFPSLHEKILVKFFKREKEAL